MSSAVYAVHNYELEFSLVDRNWVFRTSINVDIVDLSRSSFRAIVSLFDA